MDARDRLEPLVLKEPHDAARCRSRQKAPEVSVIRPVIRPVMRITIGPLARDNECLDQPHTAAKD